MALQYDALNQEIRDQNPLVQVQETEEDAADNNAINYCESHSIDPYFKKKFSCACKDKLSVCLSVCHDPVPIQAQRVRVFTV